MNRRALPAFAAGAVVAAYCGVLLAFLMPGTRTIAAAWFTGAGLTALYAAVAMVMAKGAQSQASACAVLCASLPLSLISGICILLDWPTPMLCTLVVLLAACALQIMPNLVVHVPDQYLIEWGKVSSRRSTVRGAIPPASRPLKGSDTTGEMAGFHVAYCWGTMIALGLIVIAYGVMLLDTPIVPFSQLALASTGWWQNVAVLVLGVALTLFLLLKPRQSGHPALRMAYRVGGALTFAFTVAALPSSWLPALALAAVVAGIVMVAVSFPLQSGTHSLFLSRLGDTCTTLSLFLIPPAALLAGGAFSVIRGMM